MMVLGVSVTSAPNISSLAVGVSTLGAGAGGGGGVSAGAGLDAWANADEATPSASTAARVIARRGHVIEISMKPARFRLDARVPNLSRPRRSGINENASGGHVLWPRRWPSIGHLPSKTHTFVSISRTQPSRRTMSALANRPFVKMNGLGNEIVV